MTDPTSPPPPGWSPPPGAGPGREQPAPPPPGWGPPPPPVWGPPPVQPWPPWPPPPAPPKRSPVGLVVGLCVGAAVVLVLGLVAAITFLGSRASQQPVANVDHWHAAYGVYVCDRYLAAVERNGDQNGIHSHGDGIVHVEPFNRLSAGSKATFRRFEEAEQLRITATSLRWLDGQVPVTADVSDGCDGQAAEIASFVDGKRVGGAPGGIRLRDGQVIVVALVPKGTSYARIGPPPSESHLPRVRGRVP